MLDDKQPKREALTYDELQAVKVLRHSISRGRLRVLDALYRDLSKETIGYALLTAKKDLEFNLRAVQALQAATTKLLEAERNDDQDKSLE
jgi:hypothetical protein